MSSVGSSGRPVRCSVVQASCWNRGPGGGRAEVVEHGGWVVLGHAVSCSLEEGSRHLQGLTVDHVGRGSAKTWGETGSSSKQDPWEGVHPGVAGLVAHVKQACFQTDFEVFMGPFP